MKDEGVIKFNCNWVQAPLPDNHLITPLNEWRKKLYELQLIGVTPDNIGYGNISMRFIDSTFIITGTSTGRFETLGPEHYTVVTAFDIDGNSLTATGPVKASSESLTHAMIYQCGKDINAVFHVHHAGLWKKLLRELPSTSSEIEYGTPELAHEIERLFRTENLAQHKIFAMGGHQDGVIAFGSTPDEAGHILLQAL